MPDGIWLEGFEVCPSDHGTGGTMTDAPTKWVGHAVQGYSKDPAAQAGAHPTPPHCWVCLPSHPHRPKWRGQIVPLNRSAFALKHEKGDPETNRAGAIQVEIEGFSADFANMSDEDLDWLADFVVGPMCRATGVDVSSFTPTYDGVPRLNWPTWRSFHGLTTHRNVPGNTHTDAPINLAHISARLLGGNRPDTLPIPEDDDMLDRRFMQAKGHGEVYLVHPLGDFAHHVPTEEDVPQVVYAVEQAGGRILDPPGDAETKVLADGTKVWQVDPGVLTSFGGPG